MKKMYRRVFVFVLAGLAVCGAVGLLAARHYDVSLRFLAERALKEAGVDNPRLDSLLTPPPRYNSKVLDGKVRSQHPRILLPELADWDGVGVAPPIAERLMLYAKQGIKLDDYPPCGRMRNQVMAHVACWLATAERNEARAALEILLSGQLAPVTATKNSGDSWEWALAFDLLTTFPGMTSQDRNTIAAKLRDSLESHLVILDGESVSLWHGRTSLAAQAWLLAIVLHGEPDYDPDYTLRAQGHFQQAIGALALTEAWPEGYNYWVNSRGIGLAIAASAYVNGLEDSQYTSSVLQSLRRVGLWTVYATRPDHRIEALGDEGPRVDLKDETRRVIDIIAQLTGDSVFASYSSYLERIHGRASYYDGYRWGFVLFNDPLIARLPGVVVGELKGLERYLPLSELFGAGAMNLFIARTGWDQDDTLITMRAGHTFTHHGHYDAGHFTIFKGAPLAVNSSKYEGFFSSNRLYYSIRTVAKNSLLVVRPGDVNLPNSIFERNVNDGGQRLVIPTGSRIRDVVHWNKQLEAGEHFEGGEVLDYEYKPGRFAYISADITGAYDSIRYDSQRAGGKVSSVEREFLYLYGEDRLLVRDQVIATEATYRKKWLLHTVNRPTVKNVRIVLGNDKAGILESTADNAVVENGRGRLDIKRILPEAAVVRLVGGHGFEYFIENGDSGGKDFNEGGMNRNWFDNSAWRLEIVPGVSRKADQFLVALSPSLGRDRSGEVTKLNFTSGEAVALVTSNHLVVFTNAGRLGELIFTLPSYGRTLLIAGVIAGDSFQLLWDNGLTQHVAKAAGVLELAIPVGIEAGSTVILRQI